MSATDIDDLIREGREKLQGVTEGPWEVIPWASHTAWMVTSGDPDAIEQRSVAREVVSSVDDAEFIVWARNNLPAVLDALSEARESRKSTNRHVQLIVDDADDPAPALPDEEPHYNCTSVCNGDPGPCWAAERFEENEGHDPNWTPHADLVPTFRRLIEIAEERGVPEMHGNALGLAQLRLMFSLSENKIFSDITIARCLGYAQAALIAAGVGITDDEMAKIARGEL